MEPSTEGKGGPDIMGYMHNTCSPPCSADWIQSCTDEVGCTGAGGTFNLAPPWCPSCQPYCQPGCSASNIWQCNDPEACTGAGGVPNDWGGCEPACSASFIWACRDVESCKGAGGTPNDWGGCDPSCLPATSVTVVAKTADGQKKTINAPVDTTIEALKAQVTAQTGNPDFELQAFGQPLEDGASLEKYAIGNLWACREADPCVAAGGQWAKTDWGGNCQPKCSTDMKWSCTDAASCEGVGGQFNENPWGGHCEEPCSKTNLWSCKDAASCASAGGEMASPPWCPDCPGNCNAPCSAYNPWSCPDDSWANLEDDSGEGVNLSTGLSAPARGV
jgi:hypothetical protein